MYSHKLKGRMACTSKNSSCQTSLLCQHLAPVDLASANGTAVWGDSIICSCQSGSWRAGSLRDLINVAEAKLLVINAPNLQNRGNRHDAYKDQAHQLYGVKYRGSIKIRCDEECRFVMKATGFSRPRLCFSYE